MITSARIREDCCRSHWIDLGASKHIRKLFKDQKDITKLCASELGGNRQCRVSRRAAAIRFAMLRATETIPSSPPQLSNSANRDTMKRLGREANRRKVEKHFDITVTDSDLLWSRNQQRIDNEAKLDGIYVIRTSLSADAINAHDAVAAYKSKYSGAHQRTRTCVPVHARLLPGMAFASDSNRFCLTTSNRQVAPRRFISPAAAQKANSKKTSGGDPAHSMTTLLADLATLCLNEVTLSGLSDDILTTTTKPTPLQSKILAALNVDPNAGVSIRMAG